MGSLIRLFVFHSSKASFWQGKHFLNCFMFFLSVPFISFFPFFFSGVALLPSQTRFHPINVPLSHLGTNGNCRARDRDEM